MAERADGKARWKVVEIYNSPTRTLIEIEVANYITEGEDWPKAGQELKLTTDPITHRREG